MSQGRTLITFKAGKCIKTGTRVTPDSRKGQLSLVKDHDELLHLMWKDRTTNVVEDDYVLFPGAAMERVGKVTTGRLYTVDLGGTNAFYWLQEPDSEKDKDEELIRKLNSFLSGDQEDVPNVYAPATPAAAPPAQPSAPVKQQQQAPAVQTPSAAAPSAIPGLGDIDFSQILRNLGIPTPQVPMAQSVVELSTVLSPELLLPVIRKYTSEASKQLNEHLPPNDEENPISPEENLLDNVSSPQFNSAVRFLEGAIESGQLHECLSLFGLSPSSQTFVQGSGAIEMFLNAVQAQHPPPSSDKKEDAPME